MSEQPVFIKAFDGPWHIAERKELRGDRTGELLHTFIVCACSHKQIGGPWGHRTWRQPGRPSPICKRCYAKEKRHEPIR